MAPIVEAFPRLAAEMADFLRRDGEHALADQIDTLEVIEMCDCGDDFCQSFYTDPKPNGAWGIGHRNITVEPPWPATLILDVVNNHITYIGILNRYALD